MLQRVLSFVVCLLLLAPVVAFGQGNGSDESGGAYYDFSVAGGFAMEINVWGSVNRPGKYRVPASTRLVQLISYAGGPAPDANLGEVKVVHDLTTDSTVRTPLALFDLRQYQQTADTTLNPILYPSDTVIIPVEKDTFGAVLGVVRDVGLILVSIVTLYATVKGL